MSGKNALPSRTACVGDCASLVEKRARLECSPLTPSGSYVMVNHVGYDTSGERERGGGGGGWEEKGKLIVTA